MTKVIVAETKHDCEHLLGQFLDESHYDLLIEDDTDCYLPAGCDIATRAACGEDADCSDCDKGTDERRIAFKFRKNYFSKEEQDAAYIGLREAATETQNRGLAAGPRAGSLGNRQWVKEYEYEILDQFLNPAENIFGEDPIDEIRKKYQGVPEKISTRAHVWSIERVTEEGFEFEQWVENVRKMPPDDAKAEALRVSKELVCQTTYANGVMSGITGWYDRYPRIPYGRATSYTRDNPEKFQMAYPFLQSLAKGFEDLLPWRYENQMQAARKMDPRFLVPETPFTTITVNKTFRTAAHRDAGDLDAGLSNLLVLSNNGNYSGGYLIFPEVRIAVNVRPGDLLLVNNHEVIHGNTPIELLDDEAERVSLVCYFREKMLELGSWEYENLRYEFVESRRKNENHELWRPLWNGVSPSMWTSDEWYQYLEEQGGRDMLEQYHPDAVNKASLEEFF